MNGKPVAIASPLVAAILVWLLSGSAVPMALTILVLSVAFAASVLASGKTKDTPLLPGFLAITVTVLEIWLFRNELALAIGADLPIVFHLGLGLLWWTAANALTQPRKTTLSAADFGIAGSGAAIVLGATLATEFHRYDPLLVYPLAGLPLSLYLTAVWLPRGPRRGRARPLPALAGLFVLTGFTLLTLLVESGTDRLARFVDGGIGEEADRSSADDAPPPASSDVVEGSSRRLPREADIRFDHRIKFFLQTDSPALFRDWVREPLYVRTSTVAVFENDEVVSPIRSSRWILDGDDGIEDETIALDSTDPSSVPRYTLLIERPTADALPLVAGSTAIFADALYEYADDWFQLAPPEGIDRLRYTVAAPKESRTSSPERRSASSGRAEAPGVYLNLPPSPLAARIHRLCERFDDADLPQAIRHHLLVETTYSLKFSTPENTSPVENFLFGDRTGHCELYAAAAVMMLRSVGIPSRLAYGYAGGAADRDRRLLAFRDSDFHAWAEILAPDGQWEIFDATPRVANAAPRLPEAGSVSGFDPSLYHDFSNLLGTEVDSGTFLAERVEDLVAFLTRHFAWLAGIGLALGGGFWWFVSGRHGGEEARLPSPRHRREPPPFAPGFMHELERAAEARGRSRAPGRTWREFLASLGNDGPIPETLSAAVDYYYGVRYANRPRDPGREAEFAKEIRHWREA
ncbi:MAG: transglutaminase domain-containing protein [Verrucomicrobiales bacterium]